MIRKHYPKVKHLVRRGLISAAFVLFFCDLIAAIWPSFNTAWSRAAHVGVAFASFAAFVTEHWLREELEEHDKEHEQ